MRATLADRVAALERRVAELEHRPPAITSARERWAQEFGIDLDEFEEVDVSEFVVSAQEAARILGLSVEHVHRLLAEGKLVGERRRGRGGSVLSRSSVERARQERALRR